MTFVIEKYRRYSELAADLAITERALSDCTPQRKVELEIRRGTALRAMSEIEREIDAYVPSTSRVTPSDARTFLRCRYILSMKLEQISDFMHISRDKLFYVSRCVTNDIVGASQKPPMDKPEVNVIKCS